MQLVQKISLFLSLSWRNMRALCSQLLPINNGTIKSCSILNSHEAGILITVALCFQNMSNPADDEVI